MFSFCLSTVPSGPVVNISGYAADSHSINLMWSPPPAEQHNGIIIGYVINVTVLENNDTYSLVSQTSSTLLNTLKPYRTYTFAIAARTVIGMGPTGKLITIKTPQTGKSCSIWKLNNFNAFSQLLLMHHQF